MQSFDDSRKYSLEDKIRYFPLEELKQASKKAAQLIR